MIIWLPCCPHFSAPEVDTSTHNRVVSKKGADELFASHLEIDGDSKTRDEWLRLGIAAGHCKSETPEVLQEKESD